MAFTKIVGAGIHTLSNVHTHNINSSGIITATNFVGIFSGTNGDFSGDVTIDGNLTVNGTTTTLDTNLTEVDKLEVAANNSTVGVAITQSGTGDILNLYDGSTEVFSVEDGGKVLINGDLEVSSSLAYIRLTDSDSGGDDFGLRNDAGVFYIRDVTHGANRFSINSEGTLRAWNRMDFDAGIHLKAGDLRINDTIKHQDDEDTKIRFPSNDTITFETAAEERLRIGSTGITTIKSTSNGEILRIETSAGNPGNTQGLSYMGFDHFYGSTKPAILIGSEEEGTSSYKGAFVIKLKDAAATDDDPVQRFKIDSNGRVLIGRASAYGSADADNLIVGDESVNEHQGITILSHSGKYGGIYFGDGSGSNPAERGKIIYDHPNDQLRIGTAGSAATQFYINSSGEVGISVSPASGHLLHIKNSSADSKLKIESESGNDARLILDTSNGGGAGAHIDFQIDGTLKGGIQYVSNASASDTHDIVFRNNSNNERLRINSTGQLLHGHNASIGLGRNFETSSTSGYGGIAINRFSADTGSGGLDFVKSRNASLGGNTIVQSGDNIGAITWRGADGTDFATPAAQIKVAVDGTPGSNDMPGRIMFHTTADDASSLTERLRITSAGKVLVGDGSAITPSRNLDVRGSGHQQILIGSTNNAGASLMVDGQGGGDGSGGLYCTFEAASNGHLKIINYDSSKNIIFGVGSNVGGNESVVIDSDGRVLINTTSNTNAHTQSDDLVVGNTSHGHDTGVTIVSNPSYSGWLAFSDGTSADDQRRASIVYQHSQDTLYFRNNGNQNRIIIKSNGQIGLGMSPSRHLDIKDSTGANRIVNVRGTGTSGAFVAFLDANTTDDSKCRIGSIGGNNIGMRGDAHYFQNGAGTNRMIIDSEGTTHFSDNNVRSDIADVVNVKLYNPARFVARNGKHRERGLWSMSTGGGGYRYAHMKTDMATNSSTMFLFTMRGYSYSEGKVLFAETCGYCYSSTNTIINTQNKSYDGNTILSTYKSSDGYCCIELDLNGWGSYYTGFIIDVQYANHAMGAMNYKVISSTWNNTNNHFA